MTKKPTIKFERYERDCQRNRNIRAGQASLNIGNSKGILNDFRVIIDGEQRAIWSRGTKEYTLLDIDHAHIKFRENEWDQFIRSSQGQFEHFIRKHLDVIPTLAEIETRRAKAKRDKAARIKRESEAARLDQIRAHAPELLDALTAILPLAEAYLKSAPSHPDNAKIEDARAAIGAATASLAPIPGDDDA